MKKIFVASVAAVRDSDLALNLIIFRNCRSAEEAEGNALRRIKNEIWPLTDGWYCHTVLALELPPDDILYAGYKAE